MASSTHKEGPPCIPISYTISSSTLHSGKYGPENIMFDKPQDQSNRWSGAFQGNANQWIVLRLESPVVLKTITFGKFSKPHPCNMKELKVFAGISEDLMTEVLHTGLKNDSTPETFTVRHINSSGIAFPTQYVKIVPILAHGHNFHVSIWHIALAGIIDTNYVEGVRLAYDEFRETAVLRYVLKHLRQRRLLTPYQSILSRANIHLEHPLATQLHENLVLQGNWSKSEQLIESMCASGLFDPHLHSSQPRSEWNRLLGTDADNDVPPARGGHAMCMDSENEMIYLFGGWNGEKSLDDFWVYSVKEDKWKVLSHSTTHEQNAPGARSCHKMVFDTKTGSIYVLGRLNDSDGLGAPSSPSNPARQPQAGGYSGPSAQQSEPGSEEPTKLLSPEFYRYHTRGLLAGKWDFLSIDTEASGGPPLIFDHQMVMDSDAQILYVFGGRVVDGDWNKSKYAGLYSYNVSTSKWKSLQPLGDTSVGSQSQAIPSRFGHSMVFDPPTKMLYIFSGTRDDKYLSDMYTYNTETNIATEIFSDFTTCGGPEACFTQRAVIDPALKEIYVFCGLTRNVNPNSARSRGNLRAHLSNWVYKYDTRPGKWMQVLHPLDRAPSDMPLPRFAHQVVYSPKTRSFFLHGGNAGGAVDNRGGRETGTDPVPPAASQDVRDSRVRERRLDDFWKMVLIRPGPEEIIRQAKFQIRRQQFREMCDEEPPVKALGFLQTQVSSVVDHSNVKETEMFRSLLTHLLSPRSTSSPHSSTAGSSAQHNTSISLRKSKEGTESDEWTDEIPADDSPMYLTGGAQRLREVIDPLEAIIRGEMEPPLSGARYSQRTQVFEDILQFITESEKQPSESLLDLVEKDRFRDQGLEVRT